MKQPTAAGLVMLAGWHADRFGTTLDNYAGLGKRPAATVSTLPMTTVPKQSELPPPPLPPPPPQEEQLEKLKKRSDRFGSSVSPVVVAVSNCLSQHPMLNSMLRCAGRG